MNYIRFEIYTNTSFYGEQQSNKALGLMNGCLFHVKLCLVLIADLLAYFLNLLSAVSVPCYLGFAFMSFCRYRLSFCNEFLCCIQNALFHQLENAAEPKSMLFFLWLKMTTEESPNIKNTFVFLQNTKYMLLHGNKAHLDPDCSPGVSDLQCSVFH